MERNLIFCTDDNTDYYRLLYDIESYLRLIVRWELRGANGKNWRCAIPEETLNDAENRRQQERDIGCLDERKSGLLSYLHVSELKELILETSLWSTCFKKNWGSKDILQVDFKKLIAIRNKVAHFRPITLRDMRVAYRFYEDLCDRTQYYNLYKTIKGKANWEELCDESSAMLKNNHVQCFKEVADGVENISSFGPIIFFLSNHFSIESSLPNGSIDPVNLSSFLDKYDNLITYCKINSSGNRIEIALPRLTSLTDFQIISKEFFDVLSMPLDELLTVDSSEKYELNIREGVLSFEHKFPCSFDG